MRAQGEAPPGAGEERAVRGLPVVAVGVMDRDTFGGNTDNLALVDPGRRRVLSVPRDLWDGTARRRVNRAWADGGFESLRSSLAALGLAADGGLCLRRSAVERALADVTVTVPVERPLAFLYPLTPTSLVQDGAKLVRFDPPEAVLSGERTHQWLGARREPLGAGFEPRRIARQQTFVRQLLRDGFDFRSFVADPDLVQVGGADVWPTLAAVDETWEFCVLDDVLPRRIDGQEVLVLPTPVERVRHLGRRGRHALLGAVGGRLSRVRLPTGGLRRPPRRERLLATIAVRDEEAALPAWLANVAPHVDGIVALDDASSDRSAEVLARHPAVLEVLGPSPGRTGWDEVGNHRRLVHAALEHGATWIVALDADERVERRFRDRVERAIRRGRPLRLEAFALPMRELWDAPDRWRSDGIWGAKRVPRLFRAREDHGFDVRPLHAAKAPLQAKRFGGWVTADCRVYHLHMQQREAREVRRRRYEQLDPDSIWQREGYGYLTDERGLRTRRIGRRRAYLRDAGGGGSSS